MTPPSSRYRTLTPSGSGKRAFPRPAAIAFVVALGVSVPTSLDGNPAGEIMCAIAIAVAVLSACSIASWAEQRIYTGLLGAGRFTRIALSLFVPVLAITLGLLFALIGGFAGMIVGDDGTLGISAFFSSLWFASAAIGSIVIVLLDVLISVVVPDFRSRIQLAVLSLLTMAGAAAVGISLGARGLADTIRNLDPEDIEGTVTFGNEKLSHEELARVLAMPETANIISLAFVFLTTMMALPAILSACGKLADSVMERLNPLRDAFDQVRDGSLDVRVEEGGSRELITISSGFNKMANSLSATLGNLDERNRDLAELNRASNRFVPFQFLELLGKKSLKDTERGDQVELEITVLFSDIRGFTAMAEAMGPKQTFAFINRYLGYMEAEIHREQGFINDIFGDGIMALFHTGADAALRAALGMLRAVDELNEISKTEGLEPIRIGIGMNSGPLMLGTIGGTDHLSCTVVGDPANAAARVEGMTKRYRANLLITDKTRTRLASPDDYQLRELDRVMPQGKNEAFTIYEVLDGESGERRKQKLATLDSFGHALEQYRSGDFSGAKDTFLTCVQRAPDDGSASLYLERCRHHLDVGAPKDWDGVTVLETK